MTTKGAAADVDMGADAGAVVGDTTEAAAADEGVLEGMATMVTAGADTTVGARETTRATTRVTTRIRIKAINKVKDTIMMNMVISKINKLLWLDHLKINQGSPTTTWGLQGMNNILFKRHPASTSVCA